MNGELLRLIDTIHRDKGIEPEALFEGIEMALLSAARKHFPKSEGLEIKIDRSTGRVTARDAQGEIDTAVLGRIAAQSAKQVIIQKIKEAESAVAYSELATKQGDILSGTVQSFEHGTIIVNLGKTEGILPRSEQVPGESYRTGERIKTLVTNVKKAASHVTIILSRAHPNFVKRLFEMEVPEIADKTVEIKAIIREAGFRTKIAVYSIHPDVDAVGACVGVKGARIKNIVAELGGEKIDIIKWDDNPQKLVENSMKPAKVRLVELFPEDKKARVMVAPDQLSLAIGKKGQNVRLACKLTGWEIDVVAPETAPPAETAETGSAETEQPPPADQTDTTNLPRRQAGQNDETTQETNPSDKKED